MNLTKFHIVVTTVITTSANDTENNEDIEDIETVFICYTLQETLSLIRVITKLATDTYVVDIMINGVSIEHEELERWAVILDACS